MFGKILSLTVNICAYEFRVYSFLYVIKYIIVNDYLCHLCGVILTLKSNGCDICIYIYIFLLQVQYLDTHSHKNLHGNQMSFLAVSIWPVNLYQKGCFLFVSSTVTHLCGVVYPLCGPGIVGYIHNVQGKCVMFINYESYSFLSHCL